jgi:hemoglobin
MDLKVVIVAVLIAVIGVLGFIVFQGGSSSSQQDQSLFDRLGGLPAISAVVEEFAGRLFVDPELDPFFGSLSLARQERFVRLNIEFICMATGGPCEYTGRNMFDAHEGMGTSNNIFDVVKNHLVDVLNDFDVPRPLQNELLTLVETTRTDIVEE